MDCGNLRRLTCGSISPSASSLPPTPHSIPGLSLNTDNLTFNSLARRSLLRRLAWLMTSQSIEAMIAARDDSNCTTNRRQCRGWTPTPNQSASGIWGTTVFIRCRGYAAPHVFFGLVLNYSSLFCPFAGPMCDSKTTLILGGCGRFVLMDMLIQSVPPQLRADLLFSYVSHSPSHYSCTYYLAFLIVFFT